MNRKHLAKVLILDADVASCELTRQLLSEHFTDVTAVDSYGAAIDELQAHNYDAIISDFKINDKTGLDLRIWQLNNNPGIIFVLIAGYADDPAIVEHLKTDHLTILQKPAHPDELVLPLKREFPKKAAA